MIPKHVNPNRDSPNTMFYLNVEGKLVTRTQVNYMLLQQLINQNPSYLNSFSKTELNVLKRAVGGKLPLVNKKDT